METQPKNYTTTIFFQQDLGKKLRPIIVMLEELSSLDLASAPELVPLLRSATVLRWDEAGFWNKMRFYLPDVAHNR